MLPKKNTVIHVFTLFAFIAVTVFIWSLVQVDFRPLEGSISLHNALLYTDTEGVCKDSIPDSLLTDPVVEETLQQILTRCIISLRQTATNKSRSIQLPHEWYKDIDQHPEIRSGKVLYHFTTKFNSPISELWAIAISAVNQNVAVSLNGTLLGWGGSFERPVVRNATRTQLFTIPAGKLNKGINKIDIYVISQPATKGFLQKVYIAPVEMLKPAYRYNYILRYTLSWMISLTIAVLSFFIFVLWSYRRFESEYGLFALGGIFWVIHTLDQFIIDIPVSAKIWNGLIYLSAGLLALTSIFFIHRLLDKKAQKLEKYLLKTALFLGIALIILPESSWLYLFIIHLGALVVALVVIYIFVLALIHALELKKLEWYALALALGIIAEFTLHDLLILLHLRPLYEGQLLHFGAPLIFMSFAWILLKRFVKTLHTAEKVNQELISLNQNLENRVEARGKKIRESYETIRLLGQEQILLKERSRIMRDMHDGIGVYLTSMLHHLKNDTVDKKQLTESAHNALNDLRLMIDSLGSASTDLPAMLGMFRTRISVALQSCNVELIWHVEELPPIKDFGPERALNLLRILQEAFTNALKHSGATCIVLSATPEPFTNFSCLIKIKISDNGQGFNANLADGNGLKNMQYRAKKINAELSINTRSGSEGTCVTISIPLMIACSDDNQGS